jgi:hypothetical protein
MKAVIALALTALIFSGNSIAAGPEYTDRPSTAANSAPVQPESELKFMHRTWVNKTGQTCIIGVSPDGETFRGGCVGLGSFSGDLKKMSRGHSVTLSRVKGKYKDTVEVR